MSAAPASGDRRARSTATTQTTTTRYDVERKPRRWLALLGLVPLVAGVMETNERIEDDLEGKSRAAGADVAKFSAQDGWICAGDYAAVSQAVGDVTGVVKLREGDGCPDGSDRAGAGAEPEPAGDDTAEPVTSDPEPPVATEPEPPTLPDLAGALDTDGSFATLSALLGTAGLDGALSGDGPTTLFAPNDDAFEALDPDVAARLDADPVLLAAVLEHHAVTGAVASPDLTTGSLESLGGTPLDVAVDGGAITVSAGGSDAASVIRPDIAAANGVIHEIDTVLLPPALFPAGSALDAAASFDGASITLTGTVDTEAQRDALVAGAIEAVGGDETRVVDQLAIAGAGDAAAVADADGRAAALAGLLAAFPPNTASAEGTVSDTVRLTATYLDDDARIALEAAAAEAGVDTAGLALEARPQATEDDRDQLIDDLNALFVDRTIQFAPGSDEILPESDGLLAEAAAALLQFDLTGIEIVIEGHTDSDGSDDSNLELSQNRAEAVEQALVERGIDAAALTPVGFGESQPIAPNDSPENKALNRRVTFSAQQ